MNSNHSIEAEYAGGKGTYRKLKNGKFELNFSYVSPTKKVSGAGSLEEKISQLCEQEILDMRETVKHLGAQLAAQLDDHGRRIDITIDLDDENEHDWKDTYETVIVKGTKYESKHVITAPEDASERWIALNAAIAFIDARTKNIRKAYETILSDMRNKRHRN